MKPWKWLVLIVFWFTMLVILMTCTRRDEVEPEPTPEPTPTAYIISSVEDRVEDQEEPVEMPTIDLLYLAKIIQKESGIDWPDWACMAVGEVVLNRVASPEFPNSVVEVIKQNDPYIQYEPVYANDWEEFQPDERYIDLAYRLFQGERVLNDNAIVYQSLYDDLGKPIVTYYDVRLGTTTYFSRSENIELYQEGIVR